MTKGEKGRRCDGRWREDTIGGGVLRETVAVLGDRDDTEVGECIKNDQN